MIMTRRITIAQINTIVGDIEGNTTKIINHIQSAENHMSTIVCFPELTITGYPPEDLIFKPLFLKKNKQSLNHIAKKTQHTIAIVGFIDQTDKGIFNAAAVMSHGQVHGIIHKALLPN